MKWSWRSEWPHLVLLAGMFMGALAGWSTLPDRLPVHWGLDGNPDRWGGKFEGLLLLPLAAAAVYLIFAFVPRLDPFHTSYEAFAGAWNRIRLAALALMAGVDVMFQLMMRGWPVRMGVALPLLIGLYFMVLGGALPKLRRNWFMGIRTPWTLSSTRSWDATHRFGARVFLTGGALLAAAGLVGTAWALMIAVLWLALGLIAAIVLSYRVWRDDPDKAGPLG